MLFFTMCVQSETSRFIVTKVIAATAANIFIFCPTDFASRLFQELGIYQAIWCLYFPLFISWITMRNNISYVTSIFYRFSCLVYSCPFFITPVVNHLLCKILVEFCRFPVIPQLTSLSKILGINFIHSNYLIVNSDTPILGLNLPLRL